MNARESLLHRQLACPLLVLLAASAAGSCLVCARIAYSGHWRQLYLVWNLFLAWMPLALALLAARLEQRHGLRHWRFAAAAIAWLLFFPNAPYIFTDLVHLGSAQTGWFWVDLSLILMFAWTGLIVGLLSLQLMHRLLAERCGWLPGWLFALVSLGLSGVGICIGRFLRWNSWDAVVQPIGLLDDLTRMLHTMPNPKSAVVVPLLFSFFVALAYVTLHALTHANARSARRLPALMP